jgi:D-alanyl-D-alanine carboxypeptidase
MKDFLSKALKKTHKFFLSRQKDIFFFCLPLILIELIGITYLLYQYLNTQMSYLRFHPSEQIASIAPYPQLMQTSIPDITASAAIVMDLRSQVILFSKNPEIRFSVASTTKVMTALVGLDYFQPTDILTVKRDHVDGSFVGLLKGDQISFETALYGMMLPSGNDAAYTIADNYPGGADAFIKKMNEKAQSLHLSHTHYADPAGLEDDGDYSTVTDLARLASVAIQNPILRPIAATKEKMLTIENTGRVIDAKNLNELLGQDGVIGLKTGTTPGAGEVLILVKKEQEHEIVTVVMRSESRFYDTQLLLNLISHNITYFTPQTSWKEL